MDFSAFPGSQQGVGRPCRSCRGSDTNVWRLLAAVRIGHFRALTTTTESLETGTAEEPSNGRDRWYGFDEVRSTVAPLAAVHPAQPPGDMAELTILPSTTTLSPPVRPLRGGENGSEEEQPPQNRHGTGPDRVHRDAEFRDPPQPPPPRSPDRRTPPPTEQAAPQRSGRRLSFSSRSRDIGRPHRGHSTPVDPIRPRPAINQTRAPTPSRLDVGNVSKDGRVRPQCEQRTGTGRRPWRFWITRVTHVAITRLSRLPPNHGRAP
jgi:hypothetical protein